MHTEPCCLLMAGCSGMHFPGQAEPSAALCRNVRDEQTGAWSSNLRQCQEVRFQTLQPGASQQESGVGPALSLPRIDLFFLHSSSPPLASQQIHFPFSLGRKLCLPNLLPSVNLLPSQHKCPWKWPEASSPVPRQAHALFPQTSFAPAIWTVSPSSDFQDHGQA